MSEHVLRRRPQPHHDGSERYVSGRGTVGDAVTVFVRTSVDDPAGAADRAHARVLRDGEPAYVRAGEALPADGPAHHVWRVEP